jgi:hypothetical protein
MVKLRFNLGKGPRYKKWQVRVFDSKRQLTEEHYFEPENVVIFLKDATLINSKTTAQKIFDGKHKTVCAWVEATRIWVNHKDEVQMVVKCTEDNKLRYNPKKAPYWVNKDNLDRDNEQYGWLVTQGRNLYDITDQILRESINF